MKDNFQDILKKYNDGTANAEEKKRVETWYLSLGKDRQPSDHEEITANFKTGQQEIRKIYPQRFSINIWKASAAAAAVLLILGVYFAVSRFQLHHESLVLQDSITAGQEIALLQMDGGQEIDLKLLELDSSLMGNGIAIKKLTEGRIQISQLSDIPTKRVENIIRTPKGGEFEVLMPDSSLIKLNAASEVYFYSDYNVVDREVKLLGEAFFDIHKSSKPFVVHTTDQRVTVLGTQFNIKAYADEAETTTRLLHGSVKVNSNNSADEIVMKPGDILIHNGSVMHLTTQENPKVDWVNKEIVFNQKSAEQIMNDIARWYNVEVYFENSAIKKNTFSGTISRYTDFNKVLEVLEKTESLKFEVEGRKITVK